MDIDVTGHETPVVVHTHDPARPVPHPGEEWTRFVCVSDTHSHKVEVPIGDVLLHAGDLARWGYPTEVEEMVSWLVTLPHPMKIIIGGNHDQYQESDLVEGLRARFKSGKLAVNHIHYLEHETVSFVTKVGRTLKVYGSPAAPRYASGAFQYDSKEEAREIYSQIPNDIDILLTHSPPHGICDVTREGKNAGCPYLTERLASLPLCKLHVFGCVRLWLVFVVARTECVFSHIHEAFGSQYVLEGATPRLAVNAAVASRGAKPVIVDMKL
ncbi:hypothetical protein FA15DRAFT_591415 [Coprinopsis marcescibilis]|uniref:Calcineurin-like phosphoesterase domain-containing protein n=1 Tax=Coprinopsis marcescibilis TaxID=230819 RepID=A0A5C3KY12_COPMA|nr:hypothetical protein FA15DRAFT_591415 [Coprinopsis marcescibilis]